VSISLSGGFGLVANNNIIADTIIANTALITPLFSSNTISSNTIFGPGSNAGIFITTEGKVGIGHLYTSSGMYGETPLLEVSGDWGVTFKRFNSISGYGSNFNILKSRSDTPGELVSVADGDSLGVIAMGGTDGYDWQMAGSIYVDCNGPVIPDPTGQGNTRIPGTMRFTTVDYNTPNFYNVERMRITSNGDIGINTGNWAPTSYGGFTTLSINNDILGGNIDFLWQGVSQGSIWNEKNPTYFKQVYNSSGAHSIRVNNTEYISVSNTGNVGIAQTSSPPYGALDVNGTINGYHPGWTWVTDTTSASRTTVASFAALGSGSYKGYLLSMGDINSPSVSYANGYSEYFQMKIYAPTTTVVTQYLLKIDDNCYYFISGGTGSSTVSPSTNGTTITWTLTAGVNTLQIVHNNLLGSVWAMVIIGDFFMRYPQLKFVYP
jgi:hypothetical protein